MQSPCRDDLLPGRLRNPGNLPLEGQSAETQPAKAELTQVCARTSADLAAVVLARRELGLLCVLHSFCGSCHLAFCSWLLAVSSQPSAFSQSVFNLETLQPLKP